MYECVTLQMFKGTYVTPRVTIIVADITSRPSKPQLYHDILGGEPEKMHVYWGPYAILTDASVMKG